MRQGELADLPHIVAWKLGHEDDAPRSLVRRQYLRDEIAECGLTCRRTLTQDDPCCNALTEVIVGLCHDGGLSDRGMLCKSHLDLARADLVAPGFDEVDALASDEVNPLCIVPPGDVGGVKPAAAKCRSGRILVVEVLGEKVRASNDDLTD